MDLEAGIEMGRKDAAPSPGDPNDPDAPADSLKDRKAFGSTLMEKILIIIDVGGLTIGVLIVLGIGGVLFGISAIVGWSLCGFYQYRNADVGGLRTVENRIRREVNRLQQENIRLASSVDSLNETNEALKGQVEELADISNELNEIAKKSGTSAENIREMVLENRGILKGMRAVQATQVKNLKGIELQNLFTMLINADTDGDMRFDKHEQKILKLRLIGQYPKLNKKKWDACMKTSGGSLSKIMDVVKNLMDDSIPDKDRIIPRGSLGIVEIP